MSIVLVTGASRGIGAFLARSLLDAGHHVFAGMRDPDAVNDLEAFRGSDEIEFLKLDVKSDQESVTIRARGADEVRAGCSPSTCA